MVEVLVESEFEPDTVKAFLGLSRREFLDVLAHEGVLLYDPTEQELADEWRTVQRLQD